MMWPQRFGIVRNGQLKYFKLVQFGDGSRIAHLPELNLNIKYPITIPPLFFKTLIFQLLLYSFHLHLDDEIQK